MIIDMNTELRDFTYITSVYKCISDYNLKGHKIGRKVGDMLEILIMGAVYQNTDLLKRLSVEEKLEGYTTAGHKVEFGFFNDVNDERQLFGAIECKCVGVEETTSGKGTKNQRKLKKNDSFTIDFSGRWQTNSISFIFTLKEILSDKRVKVGIKANSPTPINTTVELSVDENMKVIIDENSNLLYTTPNGYMLTEIPSIIRTCKTIRFQTLANNECTFALYDCLTGPQTIEKAKQASLVAMDLRKKVDGFWGKEEVPAGKKHMSFVHVLCEFSHWEPKSRNVIKTCIDHNLVVPDAIIIKSFELFEERFGTKDMLDFISKNKFADDPRVKSAVDDILKLFENHVFFDIEMNKYVQFTYANNSLKVIPIP